MTTVTTYRSTDASAPTLNGTVGSLVTLLDAVLVNGYGSQSAAGWTKPFSGTNKAAYRMSTVHGTGFYLNIDDNGSGAGGARETFMTGFEVMSAISTGTGQFPTSGQLPLGSAPSGAVVCRKSITAYSTARSWTVVADDTCFYLFTEPADVTNPITASSFAFGDFFSYKTSDLYGCMIIGRNQLNTGSFSNDTMSGLLSSSATFLNGTIAGHFVARSWTATGGSLLVGKHVDQTKMGMPGAGSSTSGTTAVGSNSSTAFAGLGFNPNISVFNYPNGPDGGLYLSPIWIHHNGSVRGYLKGLWSPLHDRPLSHNDTYSGAGNLAGKSFLVQSIPLLSANSSFAAQVHVETSSTWT